VNKETRAGRERNPGRHAAYERAYYRRRVLGRGADLTPAHRTGS
jgi:hypothetical protein